MTTIDAPRRDGARYTPDEDAALMSPAPANILAARLGRTPGGIRKRRHRLGYDPDQPTTTAVWVPGAYPGMTDAAYHADPVPGGSPSSTMARRLLEEPPAKVLYDLQHREGKRAFDVGHVVHARILGVGAPIVTYPDEHLTPSGNPSTKAITREWEAEQREAGLAIIARADLALVEAMAESVLAYPPARALLELGGESELSAFGHDPESGIWCRARFDRLTTDGLPIDIKTTAGGAGPVPFGRESARRGYPIQEAHYAHTYRLATGRDVQPMRLIVVEKARPHLVAVHEYDPVTRVIAADLAEQARRTYADCQTSGVWSGHGTDTLTPRMPGWWGYDDDLEEVEISLS